jgi:hypothetical protein
MTHRNLIRPVRPSLAASTIVGGCALLAGLAGLTGCAAPGSPTAAPPRPPVSPQAVAVSPQAVAVSPHAVALAPVSAPSSGNPPSVPAVTVPTVASPPVASPSAIAVPTPTIPADPKVVHAAVSAAQPPHFATPDAAMRYLAAAYNSGNETAIRHVTTPDSRTQFEAERQWVKTFRFSDCTANGAPTWDYNCVLDIIANVPGVSPNIDANTGLVVMDEVALLVAPAARTGYYVEANEGCGG